MVLTVSVTVRETKGQSLEVFGTGTRGRRILTGLPGTLDSGHDSLTSQLTHSTDIERYPRDFGREQSEFVHHVVDSFLQGRHLAIDFCVDCLCQAGKAKREWDEHSAAEE